MLIPVKRFSAAKGGSAACSTPPSAPSWPAGSPSASSPRPARCRRSSPATTTRSRRGPTAPAPRCCGARGSASTARSTPAGRRSPARASTTSSSPTATCPLAHALGAVAGRGHRDARARSAARRHERARPAGRRRPRGRPTAPARSSATSPRRSPGGHRVEVRARSPAGARRRQPRRPDPPALAPPPPDVAANDPGQPPLSAGRVVDARPGRRRRRRWRSAPIPTTSSSAPAARWPSGPAAGCVVHHLVCTDGSKGTWDPSTPTSPALVARRQDEQREAARRLAGDRAGEVRFLGHVDGDLDERSGDGLRGGPGHPRAAARRRARPRPVEALPAAPRPPPRRLARVRRHRRRPRPALLPASTASPRIAPTALLLWEADEPNHVEDVTDVRRPQARRAGGPREPVRDDDARRRCQRARRVPRRASAPASASSARRSASPPPRSSPALTDL